MLLLGFLPYAVFIAVFLVRKPCEVRENLLCTSLVLGCFVTMTTEVLSAYQLISCTMLIAVWAVVLIAAILVCMRYGISYPKFRDDWRMYLMAGIASIPLVVGFIYPPNTYDAMTYHLPRVEHWLQNMSLEPYQTAISRQNIMGPFAEMCLLHLRALSVTDVFYFTVQWVAYINCITNTALISKLLGAKSEVQWFAAFLCSAIPMAILQASSTQTDLVASWWLSSLAALTLLWLRKPSFYVALGFGCALGLACLSKGTAYPIALPFVLVFAIHALQQSKKQILYGSLAALLALAVNVSAYKRNTAVCNNFIGCDALNKNILIPTPEHTLANVLYNVAVHVEMPPVSGFCTHELHERIHNRITEILDKIIAYFKIHKKTFFPFGSDRPRFSFFEDTAQNTLHMVLFCLLIPIYFSLSGDAGRLQRTFGICVVSAFILFCSLITYQPWISRLQLPLFVLSCPMIALALCNDILRMYKFICILFLCIALLTTNLFNLSRPILKLDLNAERKIEVHPFLREYSRDALYFVSQPEMHPPYVHYKEATEQISEHNTICLIESADSYEYPLWQMLRQKGWKGQIVPITKNNIESLKSCEVIFMIDAKEKFGFIRPDEINPYIVRLR